MSRPTFLIVCISLSAVASCQATVKVAVVLNKPDAGGVLRIALCPDRNSFDTEVGCTTRSVPANANVVTAVFDEVLVGERAVKVFHDINSDGELNTSWIGWPKEPYGFSNDAPVNMGPPPFKLAQFTVKEGDQTIRIRLR